jgi:tetratricopeptide (TPR) repeat protein
MQTKFILRAALVGVIALAPIFAQKQPKPKSQKEVEALQAVFAATDPDARIAAVESCLTKYADTEFKAILLQVAAQSAQEKGDVEKMTVYSERTLEVDPKNYTCMLMLGQTIAIRTKEFDLDREEKLGRAEKYAKDALGLLATAEKPNPQITDDQWNNAKKDMTAQAHEVLAAAAVARKKYDVALAEFKIAVDSAATPDPTTMTRYTSVLNSAGKMDEAIAMADKVLAMPNLHPAIRNALANEKIRAAQLKAKGNAPAAAKPATPAPPAAVPAPPPAPAPAKQQ